MDSEPPLHRLTTTGSRNGQAFWSPNGQDIAFVSNRSGSWQIWLMSADGENQRQLSQATGPVGWPSWVPTGDRILFSERTPEGHRLFALTIATGVVSPLHHEPYQDFRPSLSPDGTRLLFDRFGNEPPPDHDLFVWEESSGALRRLTRDPGYDSDARWSPDGRRIVWHSDRGMTTRYHTQIYSSNADGSDVRRLTRGDSVSAYPTWSPDGRLIAFTKEAGGNRDIWVMNADGSNHRRVTTHPGFDGDPAWSPAGDRLLIVTRRFGGQELAVLDLQVWLRQRQVLLPEFRELLERRGRSGRSGTVAT